MKRIKQILLFSLFLVVTVFLASCTSKTKYKVNFDTDGGTNIESVEVVSGEKVELPHEPTKVGYDFKGWFENVERTVEFKFDSKVINQDTIIYAKWQVKTYKVEFDTDGGNDIADATVEYNGLISKPVNPEKEGHDFEGWYQDAELNTPWNFAQDKVTKATKLYAKWTSKTFIVYFDKSDGSLKDEVEVSYNELVERPATDPVKRGHDFKGWYKDVEGKTLWNFETDRVTQSTTIYAYWTIHEFKITFDTDGGTSIEQQTVEYYNLVVKPANPEKAGFIFDGWFSDSNKTIPWNFENGFVLSDLVLYAKWKSESTPVINAKDIHLRQEQVEDYDLLTGVTASDDVDGDLTEHVLFESNIENLVGEYTVTYKVTNSIGKEAEVTVNIYVTEATKELPHLDNRDFAVKTQNLSRPAEDMVEATFSYESIVYNVTNYETVRDNNGNLQIERTIVNALEANTSYVFSFVVKASKDTEIMPYLQLYPVGDPWTNIMGNGSVAVGTEFQVISIAFTTGASVGETYSLSVEFGQAFNAGESGSIEFKDFMISKATKVTFNSQGGSEVAEQVVVVGELITEPTAPTKEGFELAGWAKDASGTEMWDFATMTVENDPITLYAIWTELLIPEISGHKDLTIRLNELSGYDYLEGVIAYDSEDGDITSSIVISENTVEESVGVYSLTYSVTNSKNETDSKTITVTITEATKELPHLDNRDFAVKTQNLSRPAEDMVEATFSYESIVYNVTNYETVRDNNGNLQIERTIVNALEANTSYVFSFVVKASKDTEIMPYLQLYPVGDPWTNIMGNGSVAVGTEFQVISIAFTTGASVGETYSLSVEFGQAFNAGESGSIEFKDFMISKATKVTFNSQGGSEVAEQVVVVGELITEPTAPTKEGFELAGWAKDASGTEMWDFATMTVENDPITLYAIWTEL